MKIIIDRPALHRALQHVGSAVAARSPKPQLGCFLLRASKTGAGTLEIVGTDAELSLRTKVSQVDVQRTGECLVPADKLKAIIAAEEEEPTLTLDAADDLLHIKGGSAHFKMHTYAPADFPDVPTFDQVSEQDKDAAAQRLTISGFNLARLLDLTLFATSKENSRYAINGIMLRRDGSTLDVVATDGRRLALAQLKLPGVKGVKPATISAIVSTKSAALLRRLIATDVHAPDVQLVVTDTRIHAAQLDTELSANLVEGKFPPYQDVIPKTSDKTATLLRDPFTSALRRAALLTNEESRGVRLAFKPDANTQGKAHLELSARAAEVGEAAVHMPAVTYDGEAIEIGFNPSFIVDACKAIESDSITLQLQAANKPGLITTKLGTDAAAIQYHYVVMPVSLV